MAGSNQANNQTLTIGLFIKKKVTGAVNYNYVNENNSIVSYASLSPTTQTIINPGIPFYQMVIGSDSARTEMLQTFDFVFGPGTELLIAIKTSAQLSGQISVNWFEQQ